MAQAVIRDLLQAHARALRQAGCLQHGELLEKVASSLVSEKGKLVQVDRSDRLIHINDSDGTTPLAATLVHGLLGVVGPIAKKNVAADLGSLIAFLERHANMRLSTLIAEVARQGDIAYVVEEYIRTLKPKFGAEGFEAALAELISDKRIKDSEMMQIALGLGNEMSPKLKKKKVGDHLLTLHRDLAVFRAKKRAMEGRSAA